MTHPDLPPLFEAGQVAFFNPFALHARLDFDIHDRAGFAENFPILVHEYTHYLQSISTVYGLYRVLDWVRTGVRLASVLPSAGRIHVPLRQWRNDPNCPTAVCAQLEEIENRLRLNEDLEQPRPLWQSHYDDTAPIRVTTVTLSDVEPHILAVMPIGGDVAIPIGAHALAEGMAASVQRIWETTPRLDATLAKLPPERTGWYAATRTIVREIIGSEEDVDWINILLCDRSLMTRNPAATFVAGAYALHGAQITSRADAVAAVTEALGEIIEAEVVDTRADIAGVLMRFGDSDEPFAQSVRRLLMAADELLERRKQQPPFPVNVMGGDDFPDMLPLLQRYPLPCYFRGSSLLSWHGDEVLERLGEELLMMGHVVRFLLYGPDKARACPLTSSSSCHAPKSMLCGTAPWSIGVDEDGMICAFGKAMATFGALGNVMP